MVMEYGVWITDIEKCCHSLYFSLGPRLLTRLCSQLPSECMYTVTLRSVSVCL